VLGQSVVRAEVQGTEDVQRNFTVETEAIEAYGRNFMAIFVESMNLRYQINVSENFITERRIRN
jgi:hypothetical protein